MDQFIEILKISALILFNLFAIVGVVAIVMVVIIINKIKNAVSNTSDAIQGAAFGLYETVTTASQNKFYNGLFAGVTQIIKAFLRSRR